MKERAAGGLKLLGVISLEPWDDVWRRNQHLVSELVGQGLVGQVRFVAPAAKLRHVASAAPVPGVQVLTPHLIVPIRHGGRRLVAAEVAHLMRGVDLLWINDAAVGVQCLRSGQPAVYDVTDDWREADLSTEDRRILIDAETVLATKASTVVCSQVLADRWLSRYGVSPTVVQNGDDLEAHRLAKPMTLPGHAPHAVYVGTLHRERLDIRLLVELAGAPQLGQVDLVGPDCLDDESRRLLLATGKVVLHGPVAYNAVPGVMAGADVLLCPHLVDDFTLSLDAIKSFEYLATNRPVVATPSSGFQLLAGTPGLAVVSGSKFVDAAVRAVERPGERWSGRADEAGWPARARRFATALTAAVSHA